MAADQKTPDGFQSLHIEQGTYRKITAKGQIPRCIADTWKDIWSSDIDRGYKADFEVYGQKAQDWKNAEVDIFVS